MYSVSNAYSKAINADSRSVLYRVKLAGAIVADQTRIPKMVITESAGNTSGVSIGTANSSTLTFTLRKADTINYNGILVEPECGLVLPDGSTEWLPLGKFWVTNFITSNDYETVNLTCADGMYHLTDEYISELTYPTDIRNVMNEIVKQTGVSFVSSLPTLDIRVKPEGMTYREVVGHLAGCCGCNARFNRLGQLEFFWYEDSGVNIEREQQYLNGMTKLNDKPLEVTFEVVGQKEMYTVTCVTDDNGGMTATPGQNVVEGETVVLSINPFYGYELADISAVTDAGDAVTLLMDSEGGRTFVQPDSNVTVTASFRSGEGEAYTLNVRTDDNGTIRANKTKYTEGETATVYIKPDDGYEFDRFTTIPAGISFSRRGTNSSGETIYDFTIPKSDVTVTVAYKKVAVAHTILAYVDDSVYESPGYLYVEDSYTGEFPLRSAVEGTTVAVTYSPLEGYEFDYFDSSVTLTQVGAKTYTFTMPDENVEIVVHYKLSVDESKAGAYSWLQSPTLATPPTAKPYWAVIYNEDEYLPTCQKYHLVWFDSWEATAYSDEKYNVKFHGYYSCGGKNKGHGSHEWDTSTWSGNGSSGSELEWDVRVDRLCADWDDYYGPSTQYCLLASNVHLYYRSSMVFENCESSIRTSQTSYLQDGMDVREKGTLIRWHCPDTFSTPAPAANWMVLMPESGLYMTMGEDGKYNAATSYYPDSLIAFFYDSVTIQNIGAIFSDTDEEFYLASFTNGRWAYLRDNVLGWGELHVLPEGAVVGFRSPLNSTAPGYVYVDGNYYQFAGVLVTSRTLYDTNGNVFMYKNSCRICDCESETATVFSLRRTRAVADNESVTIKYENPLVYEKMVDTVSSLVQGVTYTPAKVKHRGNPAFQVGDVIRTPDKNGVYHTVIIMQQTMNFGGGMNSEITSPGQTNKVQSLSSRGSTSFVTKGEVQQYNLDMERRLSANSSLVYAALYKTIGSSEAKIRSVVEWQTEKSAAIALIEQTVSKDSASIEELVEWKGVANTAIASVTQTANANKAEIESLVEWKGDTDAALAKVTQTATNNEASIQSLTKWQGEVATSVANIEQTVNEDSSKIDLLSRYSGYDDVVKVKTLANINSWNKKKTYYVTELDAYYVWGARNALSVVTNNGTLALLSGSIKATSNGNVLALTAVDEGVEFVASNDTISITIPEGEMREAWGEYTFESIANIAMKADSTSATMKLLVKNGEVQAGIIMEAINNDESSIKISADKLDIDVSSLTVGGVNSASGSATVRIKDGSLDFIYSELSSASITPTTALLGGGTGLEITSDSTSFSGGVWVKGNLSVGGEISFSAANVDNGSGILLPGYTGTINGMQFIGGILVSVS